MTRLNFWKRLAAATVAPLAFLGALEGTAEVGFDVPDAAAPVALWSELGDVDLYTGGGPFQPSLEYFWEPRPGARFWGDIINPQGYRGPVLPRVKGSAFRIVALGDSSTMGFGVKWNEAWPAVLETILREEGRAVEVLNLGVVGFTVYQGLRYYRRKALPYSPDLVVLAFGACNDQFRDDQCYRDEEKARLLSTSAYRLRQVVDRFVLVRWLRGFLGDAPPPPAAAGGPCPPRVTPEEFTKNLLEFHATQTERGGRTAFVVAPRQVKAETEYPRTVEYTKATREAAAAAGVPLADVYVEFRAAEAESAAEIYLDAFHPSAKGHARYATIVARALRDAGVLPPMNR